MWTPTSAAWTVRGTSFALWALAAASAVYWGLKLGGGGRGTQVPEPPLRPVATADAAAIATLLGNAASAAAPAPVTPMATRFQLLGVVAGVSSGAGAAVIAVDGRPPRSFRVGANVDDAVVLKSVQGRRAVLSTGSGGELVTLEVPVSRGGIQVSTPPPAQVPPAPPPPAPAAPPTPAPAPAAAPGQSPGTQSPNPATAPVPPPRGMAAPAQAPTPR